MDPISLILAAANAVPALAKFLGAGETTQKVADQVGAIAATVAGVSDPKEAITKIAQDQALQQQFQLAVMDKLQAWDKMYLDDVANARQRDVELAKAGQKNSRANILVAYVCTAIIVLMVLIVIDSTLNDFVKGTVTFALGRLWGYLDSIFHFEFGTTRSSKKKDDTIEQLSKE